MYRQPPYSPLRSSLLCAFGCLLACAPQPPDEESPNSDSPEPTAARTAALLTGSDPGSSINGTNLGKGLRVFFGPHPSPTGDCAEGGPYPRDSSGDSITGVQLVNDTLIGYKGSVPIEGVAFKGARFCAELGAKYEGGSLTPGEQKVVILTDIASDGGLLNYRIRFHKKKISPTDPESEPVCTNNPDTGNQHMAWPVRGDWTRRSREDSSVIFTFACGISALAKCLKGQNYLPWRDDNLFVACTRMMRADYCGNGDSHTRNGIPLYFRTNLGTFPGDTPMTTRFEAIWSPQGAVCLTNYRDTDPGACGGRLRSCAGVSLLSGQLEARIHSAPVAPDPSRCTRTSSMGYDCL